MTTAQSGGSTRPVAWTDRVWGSATVVVSAGPLHLPPRADLVRALRRLAEYNDLTRVGWLLDPGGRSWVTATDLDDFCEAAVQRIDPVRGEAVGDLLGRIMVRGRDGLPLSFVICADSLSLNVAHALADGFSMTRLFAALIETARTGAVPGWVEQQPVRRPLLKALRSYFGHDPQRVRAVARLALARGGAAARCVERAAWAPSVRCLYRGSSVSGLGELKKWRKQYASGVSTIPVTLAVARAACAELGLRVQPSPLVLFDARRYVPRGLGEVAGNFCAGLRLDVERPFDPRAIDTAMKRAGELGRPLTAMAAGAARTRGNAHPSMSYVDVGRPWDVAYTHMGRPGEMVRLPWDGAGQAPHYTGLLTPGRAARADPGLQRDR